MNNCKVNGPEKGRGGREGDSDCGFGVLMVLFLCLRFTCMDYSHPESTSTAHLVGLK